MPLPTPHKGESREKYIKRCMEAQKRERKDNKQKVAICFSNWRKKRR